MSNLAKMKVELERLEIQKKKLKNDIVIMGKRFKLCLWLAGGGVALLPLYGFGVIMILAGGIMAMVANIKQSNLQSKLADVNEEIVELKLAMG